MILLTGGTGFLGGELLGRILCADRDAQVVLVVRSNTTGSATDRCGALLTELFGEAEGRANLSRIRVIDAEISDRAWGLDDSSFAELARKVTSVVHCAATTSLDVSWEDAHRINICGTGEVLRFASAAAQTNPNFFRYHHISTAYVAGSTANSVTPTYLAADGDFRNAYERSKAVAEHAVRQSCAVLPTTIYRPSIIVGDSETGQTSAFNVIYIPAKMLINGFFSSFPASPQALFDVVPIDYAANAIFQLSNRELPSGTCFHITSGLGRESSLREIIEHLFATFNKYRLRGRALLAIPPFVSPELLASLAHSSINVAIHSVRALEKIVSDHMKVIRKTLPFIPYMLSNPRFDNTTTVDALGSRFPLPPLFSSYAEQLFKFCLDTNWGKVPLAHRQPPFAAPAPRLAFSGPFLL